MGRGGLIYSGGNVNELNIHCTFEGNTREAACKTHFFHSRMDVLMDEGGRKTESVEERLPILCIVMFSVLLK